jgi:phosphohistidine phosphatase
MWNLIKRFFEADSTAEIKNEKKYQILIMRHAAKEGGALSMGSDVGLSKKGNAEAQGIAYQLKNRGIKVDKAIVSSAKRTSDTYLKMKEIISSYPEPILEDTLEHAYLEDMLDILRTHSTDAGTTLLIGHNPSVGEVVKYLTGENVHFEPANLAILTPKKDVLLDCLNEKNSFDLKRLLCS